MIAGVSTVALLASGSFALAGSVGSGPLDEHGGATRNNGDQSAKLKRAVDSGRAQNVILLIGDGMGDSEITSARNYQFGAAGRFPGIDALPMTGQYTTFSLTEDGKPDYVTDSAASGSGWATGTKTYNGALSVDIAGKPQATLLELAKQRGLKTGNATTSEIQDATAAVDASHISARSCYGPVATTKTCPEAALENGGLGSITEQMLKTRADVTMGGGAATFAETATAGPVDGSSGHRRRWGQACDALHSEPGAAGDPAAAVADDRQVDPAAQPGRQRLHPAGGGREHRQA